MKKQIASALGVLAIAGGTLMGFSGSANAATVSSDPTCTPQAAVASVAEVSHTEYLYQPMSLPWPIVFGTPFWSTIPMNADVPIPAGYTVIASAFENGSHTRTVVDHAAVPAVEAVTCAIPLPGNPLTGINCVLPSTVLATPAGAAKYDFSAVTNHIALNGKIGTTVTAKPGYVFTYGSGTLASKVFAATPSQATLSTPTVTGFGTDGVVDFGSSTCGTWKVGSKVTLTEGQEFQTHGGVGGTGVTRYRLVFTPNAGYALPSTLPGDGTKVSGSAVYFVYLPAAV